MTLEEIKKIVDRYFYSKQCNVTKLGYHDVKESIALYIANRHICVPTANELFDAAALRTKPRNKARALYGTIERRNKLQRGVVNRRITHFLESDWHLFNEYITKEPTAYEFIIRVGEGLAIDHNIYIPVEETPPEEKPTDYWGD